MPNPKATLVTLDYPPERGGVARYLGCLVDASQGAVEVLAERQHMLSGPGRVRTGEFFWKLWPKWLPLVRHCRALRTKGHVVLVSHVFPVGTAAMIAKWLGGPEYAVFFHGLDLRLVQGRWKKLLLHRVCASAKTLFVNSEATRRELLSLVPGAASELILPAVEEPALPSREEARRALGISSDKRVVLTVARFVARKGIDLALEAMADVRKEYPDAEYVVVGDGMDFERLKKISLEKGTETRWVLSPKDEEKWRWMAAADVFVMTARETPTDMEGFGIVYLEAAKAGVPSVAGKSGGVGEAVLEGQTGLLVDPLSVEEIRKGILCLLEDEELRMRLGRTAKERVEREFRWADRWSKVAKALEL